MESHEIRKLTDEQISSELAALRRKIFDMRSQAVTEKLENTSQVRNSRRTIARLLTEQGARSKTLKTGAVQV